METNYFTARFLELLAARDFASLEATLTTEARARFLLPHGLEEYAGSEPIVRRIQSWFESASVFELTSCRAGPVGGRHAVGWRFHVVADGGSAEVIEQAAFVDVGQDGIEQIDLLCSGFLPAPEADASRRHAFDAGARGCADGLAQEFRRRLHAVPVGEALEVTVRDPAAKEDLPALARLLGQNVTSTEAYEDGRLIVTVERKK